ncbi:uncharacterized protein [Clytia hemisphaerica]|uniref:uncharacterized protein n=1 Tax=Clytia hemisphaerica TaxID=252671 RepID=UPI0034D754C0
MEDKRIFQDLKSIKIVKELRRNVAILKPDKGNGVVLIDIADYEKSMDSLFSDSKKFKKIDTDPTYTRLKTIQRYLKTLNGRDELSDDDYKTMRPKHAKPAHAHGLPKTHKTYQRIPKFRPIIDTTGSTHYNVGKYLANLLNPLTINEFTLKDSFETTTRIRNIPNELFEQGYVLVSFDVVSLFTNVPLQRTIKIILDRVYKDEEIATTLKRSTLKN